MEATTAPAPISSDIEPDFIPGIRLLARLARVADANFSSKGPQQRGGRIDR